MLKLKCEAERFFFGRGYLTFLGVLALVGHIFAIEVVTMSLMLISCAFALFTLDSIRPFCAVLVLFIFQCSRENAPSMPSFSDHYFTDGRGVWLAALFVFLALALCVYLFRTRRITVERLRGLPYKFLSLLFSSALLLSGVLSGEWLPSSFLWGALEALALVALPYLLMLGLSESDKSGALNYLLMLAETVAIVLIVETVYLYAAGGVIEGGAADKGQVLYGWGIWTTAGMDMAVLIPLLMLGALQGEHPRFSFFTVHALYFCCALTLSRNALLFGGAALIASAAVVLRRSAHSRLFSRIYITFAALAALSSPLWITDALELFSDFITRGFSDNGRLELWSYGIESFLESFVFGKGFFALSTDTFRAENIFPPMLHNTFIQLAAATGVFGLISYALWQCAVITRLALSRTSGRTLLLLSYLTLLLMSLFDNFLFHIQPMFLFAVLLATAEAEKQKAVG